MEKKPSPLLLYGVPLLLAALVKGFLWSEAITPFNSDEAIVALMARHINRGRIMPFFYGQSYMGSLDAMLVALGFRLFGEQVWVIRLVQSLLYLGTVATTVTLASKILKKARAAFYAGLFVAIPTVNVVLYSTVSLGGYGEMLLIGNLLLLGGIGIIENLKFETLQNSRFYWGLMVWGLGAGFAFWVLGLSLVYSIPILIVVIWYLLKKEQRVIYTSLTCLLIGGIVGSAPWWGAAVMEGTPAVISELAGGAIAGVGSGSWLMKPLSRAVNFLIFGGSVMTGIRPPWSIRWLMLPLIPFVLVFWLAVLVYSLQEFIKEKLTTCRSLLTLLGLVLTAGFILSPYGDDPSGRYFLPFLVPMSLFGADMVATYLPDRKIWAMGLVGFLLVFNLGGIVQSALEQPPGLTTQFDTITQVDHSRMEELIGFLRANEIRTGYSNYWVSYPLAFLTQEEIVFIPRLPYHEDFRYTSRDDRYPPYGDIVESSDKIAYITTRHPELDHYLADQFTDLNISWKQERIGDYTVYYDLSEPIRPDLIGLGETTNP